MPRGPGTEQGHELGSAPGEGSNREIEARHGAEVRMTVRQRAPRRVL
jgi:hypothetical protein